MSLGKTASVSGSDVAIIGMAGRFPGARNLGEFWRNLCAGVESITFLSERELLEAGADPALIRRPNYVRAAAILDDAEAFDAEFFGFNPREAEIMDPQHRVFLECSWEALEDAGYDPERFREAIGVFAGTSFSTYLLNNVLKNPGVLDAVGGYQAALANVADSLTTRVAYKLNLRGPAFTVLSACSSSLVAVHLACQSLINFECDMALAGGIAVRPPQRSGYLYQEGGMVSPDGHCRAFDSRAQGTIFGNGVGVVVLRRLNDALSEGDRIDGVIKGSAVNNDGALKVGFTAPSVNGQAKVVAEALAVAGVAAETISYIEAHGTGTPLGDPIEVQALTKVFRRETEARRFCRIGTVKSNIGHLDAAAGISGLIKTVLALKNRKLPPSLHYETPNPEMDIDESPFVVVRELMDWEPSSLPRRAGVSAFGFGGTNAHVVLEEAPPPDASSPSRPWQLITLSARSEAALEAATDNLIGWFERNDEVSLPDVAFTLQVGRRTFAHRRVAVCRSKREAVEVLEASEPRRCLTSHHSRKAPDVAFMFPGQGAQYVGMGRELFEGEKVFREEVMRCAEYLEPHLGFPLTKVLYPEVDRVEEASLELNQTRTTQPAIFVVSYALARLWMHWGVRPHVLIGHSVGEYVAACLSGVMSVEAALGLVAARGRLMGSLPPGSMAAVAVPPDRIEGLLDDGVVIAAVNSPGMCVVSGPPEGVARFTERMRSQGVLCRPLHTSHAFHSPMMEPILDRFAQEVARVELRAPTIPVVSTVTGESLEPEQAVDPSYWVGNLRHTVRFGAGIARVLGTDQLVLLEVGPGNALGAFTTESPKRSAGHFVLASMRHPQDAQGDHECLLTALGKLWLAGLEPDWSRYYEDERRVRAALPPYPFQKTRCWVDPVDGGQVARSQPSRSVDRLPMSSWLSTVRWRPQPLRGSVSSASPQRYLLLSQGGSLSRELTRHIRRLGGTVTTVSPGVQLSGNGPNAFSINLASPADYGSLIRTLQSQGTVPDVVVVLGTPMDGSAENGSSRAEGVGHVAFFESLLHLARTLSPRIAPNTLRMFAVTRGVHAVTPGVPTYPEMAVLFGPCKVIPQEYGNIHCRQIDLEGPATDQRDAGTVEDLVAEMSVGSADAVAAYRGGTRWVPGYEAIPAGRSEGSPGRLRRRGVYLITGGLGGIGLVLADYLARAFEASLILVSRTGLPDEREWDAALASAATPAPLRRRMAAVRRLQARGTAVVVCRADVADREAMLRVKEEAERRFGKIHGIVHAAGVPGNGLIQFKTREMVEAVLSPKVAGTLVLAELFRGSELDFVVLCSSMTSLLGGVGQVDYCGANRFMDAFAEGRPFGPNTVVTSINWPAWKDVGMAADSDTLRDVQALHGADVPDVEITPEEGVEVFARVLDTALPRVVVSPRDLAGLHERMDVTPRQEDAAGLAVAGLAPTPLADVADRVPAPGPGDDVEGVLARVWQGLLGVPTVGPHDNFMELGGNSLLAIRLFEKVERELGVQLPVATIFQSPTVHELAQIVRRKAGGGRAEEPAPEFLVELRRGGSRPPLILVHALGGGVLNYRKLVEHLREDQPVFGLIARGFDGRHEPLTRVEDMASNYLREILARFPRGPYHLGGYSFGAMVAYEMMRQLTERGHEVGLLAMLDQSPGRALARGVPLTPSVMRNFAVSLRYWLADLKRESPADVAVRVRRRLRLIRKVALFTLQRRSADQLDLSLEDLREPSRFPAVRLELLEAEVQALLHYHPKPYAGVVTLFRARGQGLFGRHDTELGWSELALAGVDVHHLAGSHMTILREPAVKELAFRLQGCLDRAGTGTTQDPSDPGEDREQPPAARVSSMAVLS